MHSLNSPLEALALNYLRFGFLTAARNVWAWIAAGVSVWRIIASSPHDDSLNIESSLSSTCFSSPTAAIAAPSSEVERVAAELPTEVDKLSVPANSNSNSTPAVSAFQTEGKTSRKFAVYYRGGCEDDVEVEEYNRGNSESNDDDADALEESSRVVECWNVTMKMRAYDMGWYHYQDLKLLDGNVVRLWDDCRRKNAASHHCNAAARW